MLRPLECHAASGMQAQFQPSIWHTSACRHVSQAADKGLYQVSQQNIADFPSYGMACQMKVRPTTTPVHGMLATCWGLGHNLTIAAGALARGC